MPFEYSTQVQFKYTYDLMYYRYTYKNKHQTICEAPSEAFIDESRLTMKINDSISPTYFLNKINK